MGISKVAYTHTGMVRAELGLHVSVRGPKHALLRAGRAACMARYVFTSGKAVCQQGVSADRLRLSVFGRHMCSLPSMHTHTHTQPPLLYPMCRLRPACGNALTFCPSGPRAPGKPVEPLSPCCPLTPCGAKEEVTAWHEKSAPCSPVHAGARIRWQLTLGSNNVLPI